MFTPRVVLEARDWLSRGNPRQAAEVLLRDGLSDHRDVAAVRQEVACALVQLARQEQAQSVWAAWEAVELAQRVAPLNGDDRALYEELARDVQRRRRQQEAVEEVASQTERWLCEGKSRDAVLLLEGFLDTVDGQSVSGGAWKLHQLLAQAKARLEALLAALGPIREALEKQDFFLALERCKAVWSDFGQDLELRQLFRQARCGASERTLSQAQAAALEGQVEVAERLLLRAQKLLGEEATAFRPKFEEVEALVAEQRRQQQQQALKTKEISRRLQELRAAIEAHDLPLAYQKFYAASELVSTD